MASTDGQSLTEKTGQGWPAWSIEADPGALGGYVLPDLVGPLLPEVPGPSSESGLTRARRVYELIAARGVGYAFEEALTRDGAQLIRSPQEVLWAPRHATCLDLALVYAGGLLAAGLDAAIVLVDPAVAGQPRHALVAIPMRARLNGPWSAAGARATVWPKPPAGFLDAVGPSLDADVLLVDPNGLGHDMGTSRTVGLAAPFAEAAARGAHYLSDADRWAWRVGIPATRQQSGRFRPPDAPTAEPLRAPYRRADEAPSPLQLLRPEYQLVPFQHRHELTVLRDWCAHVRTGDRTGLAVLHGVGGAGKTRLALELAQRLRADGWYAGTLPRGGDGTAWLARVTSPLLVIVDYADGRIGTSRHPGDSLSLLKALRQRPGPPAVVVLTARFIDGQWLKDLTAALDDDRHDYCSEILALPESHPNAHDVYRRTFQTLTPTGTAVSVLPPPTVGTRWTTLDLVLLGWLAAKDPTGKRPNTSADLYEKALRHEVTYWCTVHEDLRRDVKPERNLLRTAAACVSLVSPAENDSDAVLCAVPELRDDPTERSVVRRTLATCLRPGAGEGLAVRPDPIGDHLVLRELASAPAMLHATVGFGGPQALVQAVTTLTRAGQQDYNVATVLIVGLVEAHSDRWPDVLDVATAQGGAALTALEHLAARPGTPLPLDEVSARLPFTTLALFDIALIMDRRRVEAARAADATGQDLADLLVRLSERCRHAGDRDGALASITEAVALRRGLADPDTGSPAAYLPGLAASLNNLSNCQAEVGDRDGALASITEAVAIYRGLADPDTGSPAAYLPGLAMSLHNLASCQAGVGDRDGALASITEAVTLRRGPADPDTGNPAAHLPDLAPSLNNLSNSQAGVGDRDGALASITEAVAIYRGLADPDTGNPAAYLPGLAISLNNLASCQAGVGERDGALASIEEAVAIRRGLADPDTGNPAAHLPDLAISLNNLASCQARVGDRDGALASITEAVALRRGLADPDTGNPAAYLPDLAASLHNLAGRQTEVGDRDGALASITEAVALRRGLAHPDTGNPAAHLPDLAASLNNLSNCQAGVGDRDGALASITEALVIYRGLADPDTGNPAAHLPGLAGSLNDLASCQAGVGDRGGALASITEAVALRRGLADPDTGNPAAHLPDLAASLHNLSNCQARVGDRDGALAPITEAVAIYRGLADPDTGNPAAHLPGLAASLNDLSSWQAEVGDRGGALASITEAVAIYRGLADPDTGNPAAHLPGLAASLNNLASRQAEVGDLHGELASITEAVTLRRGLADPDAGNPAAYLPDLAISLNNLSNCQARAGDRDGALAFIEEAVAIRRGLADPDTGNPAAYLPGLAISLNNLASCQAGVGDRDGALASITETVAIRRELADPDTGNPAAYLPDLAISLHNLSNGQAGVGDRDGALASITEAVATYRGLADPDTGNPAAYLPGLAISLRNLASCQAGVGDRGGALASITEAVAIHRWLAAANPASYLPDLATSLDNLSQLYGIDRGETADQIWEQAIADLPHPAARAELQAAWAGRLARGGYLERARNQVIRAAEDVDAPTGDDIPDDPIVSVVRSRTRWTLRGLIHAVPTLHAGALPLWATAAITDEHLALVDAAATAGWPQLRAAIEEHTDVLLSSGFRAALHALTDLYPEHPAPGRLLALLSQIDQTGLSATIDHYQEADDRSTLVQGWINTPTWPASFAFYRQHQTELATPQIRELLAGLGTGIAHQHVAILDLAVGPRSLEEVYVLVTDPGTAEAAVLDAIEHGRLDLLHILMAASPALQTRELTMALITAVLALAEGHTDTAYAFAGQIARHAEPTQRRAYAVHLRGLHRHVPQIDGLTTLIELLAKEDDNDVPGHYE